MGLTSTLTGTIYRDDGAVATGAVVTFTLCAPRNTHWTSNNRVVLRAVLSATTDGSGNFSQVVARNDQLTPDNTYWKVECAEAALLKHIAANADTLDVIVAPDLDASAQVFSGLDDPDDDWVAHGHVQTLTAAEKLQAATNLGLNLSASQLLGQASSGGTGLPVAVTLGTGLAMSGATLNATVTGTANEITVTGTTTTTLSLPSALTFTGKTVTGGTFASPSLTTPTIGDGTESAPSLSFTSDTNTGLYRPTADTLGIVGGGNDVVRMTGIASATDYIEIKNGIGVGTPLHVLAEGASANIGMHLQPKGSGLLTISDGTDFNKGLRFRSSSSAAGTVTLLDAVSSAGRVITLPDATGTLALVSGALGTPASGDFSTGAFIWPTFDQNTTGSAATLTTTRTIGGADFNGSADVTSFPSPGPIGGTTPNTIAGTTGTFSGDLITTGTNAQIYTSGAAAYLATYGDAAHIYTDGANAQIYTSGLNARIATGGANAHISTGSSGAYIQTRSTFKLAGATFITTLSHAATADRAIAFPDAAGTLLLANGSGANLTALNASNVSSGTLAAARGGTGVSNTGTITLGGNLVTTGAFNTTFAQAATTTVTLPSTSATMARTDAAQTFTGVQSMTSPAITTSITTPSTTFALVNATATTVNFAGGASTALNMGNASGTNTVLGANVLSTAGAESKPVLNVSGVPFAGTGTTSFPLVYINDANATASSTLNTAGTYFGINIDGTQDGINVLKDGVSKFKVDSAGKITSTSDRILLGNGGFIYWDGTNWGVYTQTVSNAPFTCGTLALNGHTTVGVNNVYDLGTASLGFRDLWVARNGTIGGTLAVTGTSTFTGDIIAGSATMALLNTTATTVNLAGAATAINIGAATATLKLGTATSTSTATPAIFDCGGTYADTVTSAKAKWKLYSDGTAINTYGIGISLSKFNFFTASSAAYSFLFADVEKANLSNAGLLTLQGGLIATTGAFSSTLAVTGATTLTGNLTSNGALISTPQALSGAGAVNVTTLTTAFTSTGAAQALSLADGTSGQLKTISHVVDGGSGVLTPTTKSGYTTITFTNVGDSVTLQYHTTAGWCIVGVFGAVPA